MHKIPRSTSNTGSIITLLLLILYSCLLVLPQTAAAATITCSNGLSGCHFQNNKVKDGTARNTPDGYVPGTHARHAGYSTSSTKREYKYACTVCHGLASGYNNAHQSGYKNISGTSLLGSSYSQGKKIANTNNPTFGNCANIYCHSNGRGANMGQKQYSSSKWGGTESCLGCHGGRSTSGPNYYPARSVGNFTLSTTHSQHLKYPAANISCQMCHSKTVTDAYTLKSYTGVQRHNNGVRDVTFLASAGYGTYTSYKSTESGSNGTTKTCNNVSCHGGKSRGSWSYNSTNNNNTCVHCHGIATTGTGNSDLRAYAPGFRKQGTSTDQLTSSADIRVGSHFKHLSSVYMKNIKCNECHSVPVNVFDGNHMGATSRYNSQTLVFSQSSSAVWNGATGAKLAAFSGYTVGTASKAATCSSVYCHGNRLKNGETGGTYRKPYWNYSAMINYTDPTNACKRCHGYPPTSNSHTASTTCSDCHKNMSAADNRTFLDKTLHINRVVDVSSDCNGCHKYDTTGTNTWSNVTVGTDVAHYKHIVFIKSRLGYGALQTVGQTFATGENLAVCGTCHTQTAALHNNGSKDVTFGASGTFPNTMGGGTGNSMSLLLTGSNPYITGTTGTNITCSNLMCHYATTPNWYTSAP